MSADNYWIVRRAPGGKFVALMGFASADADPVVVPDSREPFFDSAEAALVSVIDDYAEYGHSIHPECFEPSTAAHESPVFAAEERDGFLRQWRMQAADDLDGALKHAFEVGFSRGREAGECRA